MTDKSDRDRIVQLIIKILEKLGVLDQDIRNFDEKQQYYTDVDKISTAFFTVLSAITNDAKKVMAYSLISYNLTIAYSKITDLRKWLIETSATNAKLSGK